MPKGEEATQYLSCCAICYVINSLLLAHLALRVGHCQPIGPVVCLDHRGLYFSQLRELFSGCVPASLHIRERAVFATGCLGRRNDPHRMPLLSRFLSCNGPFSTFSIPPFHHQMHPPSTPVLRSHTCPVARRVFRPGRRKTKRTASCLIWFSEPLRHQLLHCASSYPITASAAGKPKKAFLPLIRRESFRHLIRRRFYRKRPDTGA